MTFGQKLQYLRKERGMSQEKLAAELGVSRQAVSKWELDSTLPETENVIKIGKIFDVSYDYLLKEEEERNTSATETKAKNSTAFVSIVMFIKKYGYLGGYIFSAISLYCLFGYTVSFFAVYQSLKVPEGFTSVVENNHTGLYTLLIFYIVLALSGTVGGVLIAKWAEKRTVQYRTSQENTQSMEA